MPLACVCVCVCAAPLVRSDEYLMQFATIQWNFVSRAAAAVAATAAAVYRHWNRRNSRRSRASWFCGRFLLPTRISGRPWNCEEARECMASAEQEHGESEECSIPPVELKMLDRQELWPLNSQS